MKIDSVSEGLWSDGKDGETPSFTHLSKRCIEPISSLSEIVEQIYDRCLKRNVNRSSQKQLEDTTGDTTEMNDIDDR